MITNDFVSETLSHFQFLLQATLHDSFPPERCSTADAPACAGGKPVFPALSSWPRHLLLLLGEQQAGGGVPGSDLPALPGPYLCRPGGAGALPHPGLQGAQYHPEAALRPQPPQPSKD